MPDEQDEIEATLRELVDERGCCLVVTTGGTGPARRDVTPEATEAVCDRMMPGYGEQMRAISLRVVPTAVLSRQTAGLRGTSLILNLPGKPKSIWETLPEVFASIPACIDIMDGPYMVTNDDVCKSFRPCSLVRKEKPSPQVTPREPPGTAPADHRTSPGGIRPAPVVSLPTEAATSGGSPGAATAAGGLVAIAMLYFAAGREATGTSGETVEVPQGTTAAGLVDLLVARHPALEGVVGSCVLAIDQEYFDHTGDAALPLGPGTEVALIPPISGG